MGDKGVFVKRGGNHDVEEGFVIRENQTSRFTFLGNAEHLDMEGHWVFRLRSHRIVGITCSVI